MQEECLQVIQNQTVIYPFRKQGKHAPMYSKRCNQPAFLTSVKLVKFWRVKRLSQMAKAGLGQTTWKENDSMVSPGRPGGYTEITTWVTHTSEARKAEQQTSSKWPLAKDALQDSPNPAGKETCHSLALPTQLSNCPRFTLTHQLLPLLLSKAVTIKSCFPNKKPNTQQQTFPGLRFTEGSQSLVWKRNKRRTRVRKTNVCLCGIRHKCIS